jgi:hypothetical protein
VLVDGGQRSLAGQSGSARKAVPVDGGEGPLVDGVKQPSIR